MLSIYNFQERYSRIPNLRDVEGWEEIEIEECREKLIPLSKIDPERILIKPQYYLVAIHGALEECYARESVAHLLVAAARKLPFGYKLVIWDAWRPIEVQQALFDTYKSQLKAQNRSLGEKALARMAKTYVSLPSVEATHPSPHSTGGAVDLSIIDCSEQNLEMGTVFDEFNKKSYTRYYEQKEEDGEMLSYREKTYQANRRLLFYTMTSVGFTNYLEEWWHFDYGNQWWAKIKGKTAIYGKVPLKNVSEEI